MPVLIVSLGVLLALAANSWIPFAISSIIAFGWQWLSVDWLHRHFHTVNEEDK